jgi:hypothetical protein
MNIRTAYFLFFIIMMLVSCNEAEVGNSKDVYKERIYFDYHITAEEGIENVTCKFQYKFGGKNGTTLVVDEPGKVELDGEAIKADSAKYSGVYYEINKPLEQFKGKHSIVFTANDKTQYKEEFEFTPIVLAVELPEKISRTPFIIKLKDIAAIETPLRLVMVDTAFASTDVNEVIEVVRGEINITQNMLNQLVNGPVSLEIYKEEDKPLKQHTKEGGKLSINYSLKREFELIK